jgi:hypothetical protein
VNAEIYKDLSLRDRAIVDLVEHLTRQLVRIADSLDHIANLEDEKYEPIRTNARQVQAP